MCLDVQLYFWFSSMAPPYCFPYKQLYGSSLLETSELKICCMSNSYFLKLERNASRSAVPDCQLIDLVTKPMLFSVMWSSIAVWSACASRPDRALVCSFLYLWKHSNLGYTYLLSVISGGLYQTWIEHPVLGLLLYYCCVYFRLMPIIIHNEHT